MKIIFLLIGLAVGLVLGIVIGMEIAYRKAIEMLDEASKQLGLEMGKHDSK